MPGYGSFIAVLRAAVIVDLAARSTGTGLRHLPEIILAPEIQYLAWDDTGLAAPFFCRFVVLGYLSFFIAEAGSPYALFWQSPDISQ